MGEPALRLVIQEPSEDDPQPIVPPSAGRTPEPASSLWGKSANRPAWGAAAPAASESAEAAATGERGAVKTAATGPAADVAAPVAEPPADTSADLAEAPEALPELVLPGREMTAAERSARLARHWLATAREEIMRPGDLPHAAYHGKPQSLAELHEYAVSRPWVPEDYAGSVVPALGALYVHTVAKGGTATLLALMWVIQRPLRLAVFLLTAGVLAGAALVFG